MRWKSKGGLLAIVGFMLSPLSWWNDAFVNLPLAMAFGWGVALFYPPAFEAAVIVGYWLTNVLGLCLMHHGLRAMLTEAGQPAFRRELKHDLLISLLYTLLIVLLFRLHVLQPWTDYFQRG